MIVTRPILTAAAMLLAGALAACSKRAPRSSTRSPSGGGHAGCASALTVGARTSRWATMTPWA
jgi:hypothetical protein